MSSDAHREAARDTQVTIGLVTVSDTRTPETDVNGAYLRERIAAAGAEVSGYHLAPDEPDAVRAVVEELAAGSRIVLVNGGTGLSARDTTFDALDALLEKRLPGFGELFRMLSWEQVGAAAMLSRATAGTFRGAVVISTPGSPKAVALAWERLIEPELRHLAWEVGR
jgi:molybdenum cofactor biosynthesis protein B